MRRSGLMCVLMSLLVYTGVRAQVTDTSKMLNPVIVTGIKTVNGVGYLPDVKGSIIYAGKKTEVIIVDSLDANKAINNSRQILGRIPGLNIVGIWLSEDSNVKIEIYKAGPQYFGRQVWGQFLYEADGTTPKKDVNNSNESLRRRNLKNLVILNNFDYDHGVYTGGTFYDYKSGKKYNSIIKLHGSNVLKVRDYTALTVFGKTTKYTRIPNEMPPR